MYSLIKENIVKLTISKYETKCVLMTTLLLELSGIHVVIVCKTHHAVGPAAVQRGCDLNLRGYRLSCFQPTCAVQHDPPGCFSGAS